ncbi:MAG: hypothetical protein LUE64_00525 [Candidatus Gastranaerophilales bacterium]|nr:hypothetical protein [Candidatus Gastranaerophilales bacterium]
MSLSTEQAQVIYLGSQINALELRLLKISAERNMKAAEGAAQVSVLSSEMYAAIDAVKAQLPEEYTSDQYKEIMAQEESIETEYQSQIDAIQKAYELADEHIETYEQVPTETKKEAITAEYDEWSEALQASAEDSGYFDDGD